MAKIFQMPTYSSQKLEYFSARVDLTRSLRLITALDEVDYCPDMGQHPLCYQVHTVRLPASGRLRDFMKDKTHVDTFYKFAQVNYQASKRQLDLLLDADEGLSGYPKPSRVLVADFVSMAAFLSGWREIAHATKFMELQEIHDRWYTESYPEEG